MSRPTATPLPDTLHTITIDEARTDFDTLDQAWGIIPNTHRSRFEEDWASIRRAATEQGLTHTAQLVTAQSRLLTALTGETELSTFKPFVVAEQLHRLRNTVLMVVAGAAGASGLPVEGIYARSVNCLQRRTGHTHRPFLDDEIALARTAAVITITQTPTSQAAGTYTLLDAGQNLIETTQTTLADLDDATQPTLVAAAGTGAGIAGRILPLDTFHSMLLATIAATTPDDQRTPLTYKPRTSVPGTNAAACSASGVIKRFLEPLHLYGVGISPASITRWRVAHAWDTHEDKAWAMEIAGTRDLARATRIADRELEVIAAPLHFDINEF